MRQIGTLPNQTQAQRLAAFLLTQEIDAHAEEDGEDWAIWVRDENDIEKAKQALDQFRLKPEDSRYAGVERAADSILKEKEQQRRRVQENVVEMRGRWQRGAARRLPVVFTLIALSVLATLASNFGQADNQFNRGLSFWDPIHSLDPDWNQRLVSERFVDIRAGQVWRLVTPIFMHGDWLHIVFNLYWIFILGSQIESRKGSLRLVLIALAIALASNIAQATFHAGPFLGISGVVFGLFGYVWMKTIFDPGSGIFISQFTIVIVVVYFFLCLTSVGIFANIANTAHAVGLVVGLAIGYAPVMWDSLRSG